MSDLLPTASIQQRILFVRGKRVLLDSDLARFYGVTTFNLNKAVARNPERFPEDFVFTLTPEELQSLKFQFGISNVGRGGRRTLPKVYTDGVQQHGDGVARHRRAAGRRSLPVRRSGRPIGRFAEQQGVAMLASVLRTERAAAVSVALIRAFVRLREMLAENRQLAAKLAALERQLSTHDGAIRELFAAIRQLLDPTPPRKREIGFHAAPPRPIAKP